VQMLADSGVITQGEFALLDRYFRTMTDQKNLYPKPDLILYIKSEPRENMRRIQARGRPEEENIEEKFLDSLHYMHESWLVEKKFPVPAPVVTLENLGKHTLEDFIHKVNTLADNLIIDKVREHADPLESIEEVKVFVKEEKETREVEGIQRWARWHQQDY